MPSVTFSTLDWRENTTPLRPLVLLVIMATWAVWTPWVTATLVTSSPMLRFWPGSLLSGVTFVPASLELTALEKEMPSSSPAL